MQYQSVQLLVRIMQYQISVSVSCVQLLVRIMQYQSVQLLVRIMQYQISVSVSKRAIAG